MTHLSWFTSSISLALALALAIAIPAHAQSSAVTRPDPLDAKAPVPDAVYRSALSAYRPYAEQSIGSWREANETVNRIGGWRAYAREAQQPQPSASPASAPKQADTATPPGNGGHPKQ